MTPFINSYANRVLQTLENQINNATDNEIKQKILELYVDVSKAIIECEKEIIVSDNKKEIEQNKINAEYWNKQGEIRNECNKINAEFQNEQTKIMNINSMSQQK